MARKIGYLVPQFPGQTHAFFWREIQAMERMGAEVRLLSTSSPVKGIASHAWSGEAIGRTRYLARVNVRDALSGLVMVPAAEVMRESRRSGLGFAKNVCLMLPAAYQLVKLAKAEGLEHVHVHSCARAALVAALANRMSGLTYSLTLHGELEHYGPGQPFVWRNSRFATVVTQKLLIQVESMLKGDLPERIVVQPMGVDSEFLKRDAPYVPWQAGEVLKLFCCARLNFGKGLQELFAAVRTLVDGGYPVKLTVAGEDEAGGTGFRRFLESEIVRLALEDHIILAGAQDEKVVKSVLLDAHIFVLASHIEALPVSLMEAMSCEVPVIGPETGGVGELIRNGIDGLLVPPRQPEQLASTIRALANDPAKCMELSQAGRARVVGKFDSAHGAAVLLREIG